MKFKDWTKSSTVSLSTAHNSLRSTDRTSWRRCLSLGTAVAGKLLRLKHSEQRSVRRWCEVSNSCVYIKKKRTCDYKRKSMGKRYHKGLFVCLLLKTHSFSQNVQVAKNPMNSGHYKKRHSPIRTHPGLKSQNCLV